MNPTPAQADYNAGIHVPTPLHRCSSFTVLHELFDFWGNVASPPTDEENELPPGWMKLQLGGVVRFFHAEDLQSFLADLHAQYLKALQTSSLPLSAS